MHQEINLFDSIPISESIIHKKIRLEKFNENKGKYYDDTKSNYFGRGSKYNNYFESRSNYYRDSEYDISLMNSENSFVIYGLTHPVTFSNNEQYYWELTHQYLKQFKETIHINFNIEQFFAYCYYLNYHKGIELDNLLKCNINVWKRCTLMGFSPISAALISNVDNNTKSEIIQKLCVANFKITDFDLELIKCIFLNELFGTFMNSSLMFLKNELVHDINKHIIELAIALYKKEYMFEL
jgi:hypothetical protein